MPHADMEEIYFHFRQCATKEALMQILISNTLNLFWKKLEALIGDNCSINQSFAGKENTYFIGCASHRFNLAMKSHINSYEDELGKINEIMMKLKHLIPAAKLRVHTHLKAKKLECHKMERVTLATNSIEVVVIFTCV
jgi:hypothetical protein